MIHNFFMWINKVVWNNFEQELDYIDGTYNYRNDVDDFDDDTISAVNNDSGHAM